MKQIQKMCFSLFLCIVLILPFSMIVKPETVYAGVWDNAYSYYQTYGTQAIFHATSQTDGEICFCSSGYTSSSGTKYRTVGWQMTIVSNGTHLQTIYFALGGSYLRLKSVVTYRSYEYDLYTVMLSSVKARLNQASLSALNSGNCTIVLDACMIVTVNGTAKGGMSDYGTSWGTVYYTYNGIANAKNWSTASKKALLTYYGKSVVGLFYTVSVSAGPGVASVSGGGTYCYGVDASLSAIMLPGYVFSRWEGSSTSAAPTFSSTINANCAWTAYGTEKVTEITYYRNFSASDWYYTSATYRYTQQNQTFLSTGWYLEGYHFLGWSNNRNAVSATYQPLALVPAGFVDRAYPRGSLFAIWEVNTYTICYEANGHSFPNAISRENRKYTDSFQLATVNDGDFLGWCLNANGQGTLYQGGERVRISDLAQASGVTNTNGAQIVLYAIWDEIPSISVSDLYYSVQAFENGMLTETELSSHAKAYDREDGDIVYGIRENNRFYIENYSTLFSGRQIVDGTSVRVKFVVYDSKGHKVEKEILVHFTDSTVRSYDETVSQIRFISAKYIGTDAGLASDSVWYTDPEYYALLQQAGLVE